MVKARSIASRGLPRSLASGASASNASMVPSNSGNPSPVNAETACRGAPANVVPCNSSATSSDTSSSISSSTRSFLVITAMPRSTPRRSRIARCSLVCGITPSSAATTSSARSMPPAPASMFLTKRSCPGTSTMLISRPLGSLSQAKPRSMVIPRCFSSCKRSGSIPVKA